jgi:hypothetical protein
MWPPQPFSFVAFFRLWHLWHSYFSSHPDPAGADHRGTQAATAFKEGLGPGCERPVHPITRPAFFPAEHRDAIHAELAADQAIQAHPAGDHVAPQDAGSAAVYPKAFTEVIKHFGLKQGDLSFVIRFITKKAVSHDAALRDALNAGRRMHRVPVRGHSVVAEKVVARRNEKVDDFTEDGCHEGM